MPARNDPTYTPNPWNQGPGDHVAKAETEASTKRGFQGFPRRVYRAQPNADGFYGSTLVESQKELDELGDGWAETPPTE